MIRPELDFTGGPFRPEVAWVIAFLVVLGTGCGDGGRKTPVTPGEEETGNGVGAENVAFADSSLEVVMRTALGKLAGMLTEADLLSLTTLEARAAGIADLHGIGQLKNLTMLDLSGNRIKDISPLAGLTHLEFLSLSGNEIRDISSLAKLSRLVLLLLDGNEIADISPLLDLRGLEKVGLAGNPLAENDLKLLEEAGIPFEFQSGGMPADPGIDKLPGKIAYCRFTESSSSGEVNIYIMEADGSNRVQLTYGEMLVNLPAWSPDGTRIAFTTSREGNYEIFLMGCRRRQSGQSDARPGEGYVSLLDTGWPDFVHSQ